MEISFPSPVSPGANINPIALRMAKTPQSFGRSECNGAELRKSKSKAVQKFTVYEERTSIFKL